MILAIWLSGAFGAVFGLGLLCGAMIHRGHPVRETPMRVVKARGEFVDRRV